MAKIKYYTFVEPHLDKVKDMAAKGATYLEIATALGISEATFYKYLDRFPDLRVAIIEGRQAVAQEVKRALLKKALGFNYTETKKITKIQDGEEFITLEEKELYSLPSEQAAAIILRNCDADFIDRDRTSIDLRKEELELKKKIAESNNFDLDFFTPGCVDTSQKEEKKKTKYDTI